MEKLSYGIAEAVRATGIGRTTLYSHINAGSLKVRRVGGRTIILADDLKAFLEGCPAPAAIMAKP